MIICVYLIKELLLTPGLIWEHVKHATCCLQKFLRIYIRNNIRNAAIYACDCTYVKRMEKL